MSPRRHVPELLHAFRAVLEQARESLPSRLERPNHRDLDFDSHVTEAGVQDAVPHIPHADEAELADLYSGAPAFVPPTTNEGISAMILEAMAGGAPVITVDHATIHEEFAEDALVLEAPDITRLADAMLEAGRNTDLAQASSRGGREVVSGFSGRKTVR